MTSTLLPNNPVIDPAWYAKELAGLKLRLAAEFPAADEAVIDAALDLATQRLAVPAKIPNFLPVLVGRDARAQLTAHLADARTPEAGSDLPAPRQELGSSSGEPTINGSGQHTTSESLPG